MAATHTPLSEPLYGERIVAPGETIESVGRTAAGIVLDPPPSRWRWSVLAGSGGFACVLAASLLPIGSGHAASALLGPASRDAWLGIAHGSLLVSAVLLLAGVEWRCAVSRIAETVALVAAVAALFCALVASDPAVGLNGTSGLYPPFGSPAAWHALGMGCFTAVCGSLWFVGLLPDLATLRDRAGGSHRASARVYRVFAAGWRGSAAQWRLWVEAYRAVALLGALLAIALQAGGSVELAAFALSDRHDSLLPVTLLVDAVLGGVGVTAALVVTVRTIDGLGAFITGRHLDILARLILALGLASLYCHAVEIVSTLLLGDVAARAVVARGMSGDLAAGFWTVLLCGLLPPQVFWLRGARRSAVVIAWVGTLAAIGSHADHVMALASTGPADGSDGEAALRGTAALSGSIGLFVGLLLLVLRHVPMVSIVQLRQLVVAHNRPPARAAVSPAPGRLPPDIRLIEAEFASEKELAAAARALLVRDRSLRVDAFGPVPIDAAFEALRPGGRTLRRTALVTSLGGGLVFMAAGLGVLDAAPQRHLPWPSLLLPGFSVALAVGAIAVLAVLLWRVGPSRQVQAGTGENSGGRSDLRPFVLTAETGDGVNEAGGIVQRLADLPAGDGRPLAIRGLRT